LTLFQHNSQQYCSVGGVKYEIEEALNVKITGDQKLTPFPAFTISTRTDGKRYSLLSEPVSDWFVNGWVAQSMDPWHEGLHTTNTVHDGVDFFYRNGFLINFYAHGLSTGDDGPRPYPSTAGYLIPDIKYCMNTQRFPRLWSSSAREVYAWWIKRYAAQVSASFTTNGTHSVATVTISGSQDTNTAIEILASGLGSAVVARLLTNGATNTTDFRTEGELIKVKVGTTVTNVQLEYFAGPLARNDFYITNQTQALNTTSVTGVLSNDWSGVWSGLIAITNSVPQHGSLTWHTDGSFTYSPVTNGTECFTYHATDGINDFGTAMVTLLLTKTGTIYSDDFQRCSLGSLFPWQVYDSSSWNINGGVLQGGHPGNYGYAYVSPLWTNSNYSIEAQVQFSAGSCGGGVGARLNPTTGAHYAAWLYPDGSFCGGGRLALVKFSTWVDWGYNGASSTPMTQTNVTIGAGWHPLKLVCSNSVLQVYYHGTNVITMTDADTAQPVYTTAGISADVFTGNLSLSNLLVTPVP
jgi:hypothetical protein